MKNKDITTSKCRSGYRKKIIHLLQDFSFNYTYIIAFYFRHNNFSFSQTIFTNLYDTAFVSGFLVSCYKRIITVHNNISKNFFPLK